MNTQKITVHTTINAHNSKVWTYYTDPQHIKEWNFANADWHCPIVENDMQIGGKYYSRMEAKDGSFGFDFEAIYSEIIDEREFTYQFGPRTATVKFNHLNDQTEITITFDPETENPVELQKGGWQAILDNFKKYTESH